MSRIVSRHRIRTKWPGQGRSSVGHVRSDNFARNAAVLDPSRQRTECVKHVRAWTAAAMLHPGNHEQADKIPGTPHAIGKGRRLVTRADSFCPGDGGYDSLVIVNRFKRRNPRIGPSMVKQQLSAVGSEALESGIRGVYFGGQLLVGERHILIVVPGKKIPTRVVEYEVLEKPDRTNGGCIRERLRRIGTSNNERLPADLISRHEPWIDQLAPRVAVPSINVLQCLQLLRGQARGGFGALAQER